MEKKSLVSERKLRQTLPAYELRESTNYEMLVFCHLRWNFVYQRPQHLISRLSTSLKTLFVEEPIAYQPQEEGTYEIEKITDQLHVLRPKVNSISGITGILRELLPSHHLGVGWFYSAAFSEVLSEFKFDAVVYDCMDELTLFRGAAQE